MTTFATPTAQVEALYVGYFGRAGDPAGANYWVGFLSAGATTLAQTAADFAVQPEATTKYPYLANPTIANPATFVDQVYRNLFNHAADPAGKAYWMAQLQAAGGNPQAVGQFILDVISGAVAGDDLAIRNKVDVAQDFTTTAANLGATWTATVSAQSSLELAAVNSQAATVTAAFAETVVFFSKNPSIQLTFTLQVDTLVTSAPQANFNAPLISSPAAGRQLQSLQPDDAAIDLGPNGTFTAILNSGSNTPLVTLRGIPTATITSLASGSGFSGNITGLTTLYNANSTGSLSLGIPGLGLNTALATVNVSGASMAGGASTQAFIAASALSGATDAVAVNVSGELGTSTVRVGAAQVVLMNDAGPGTGAAPMNAYETETVSSNSVTFLQLSNAASGVLSTSTLNIKGGGALQLSAATGADFSNLTRIDASASTGDLTITGLTDVGAAGTPFNAGAAGLLAGNVRLTSFTGGAGVDWLDISNMTPAQVGAFTTLAGGGGRDTLVLNAAVLTSASVVPASGFEIVGVSAGLSGIVDVARLGANVDTIQLLGSQAGDVTINNAPATFALDVGGFGSLSRGYNINGPASAADVLNISDSFAVGALVTTGFETINFTALAQEDIFSVKATPTTTSLPLLNIIDNAASCGCSFDIAIGDIDVGAGTIHVSGTGIGGVAIFSLTAGSINASGLNVGAGPTVRGLGISAGASAPITIVGSNGSDFLTGSAGADVISGGAGDDIILNTNRPAVSAGDTLTGGSGNDTFFLVNSSPPTALPAAFNTAPTITDFSVNPATLDGDLIMLSPFSSDYAVSRLQATFTAPGQVPVQAIGAAGSAAMLNPSNELVKLTQGTATAGLTLQQAFNAAIGSATITGATASADYFFTMYDMTNGTMAIGIVNATNGTNTVIEAGDTIVLVGTLGMSGSDYASLASNQFTFDTPS